MGPISPNLGLRRARTTIAYHHIGRWTHENRFATTSRIAARASSSSDPALCCALLQQSSSDSTSIQPQTPLSADRGADVSRQTGVAVTVSGSSTSNCRIVIVDPKNHSGAGGPSRKQAGIEELRGSPAQPVARSGFHQQRAAAALGGEHQIRSLTARSDEPSRSSMPRSAAIADRPRWRLAVDPQICLALYRRSPTE